MADTRLPRGQSDARPPVAGIGEARSPGRDGGPQFRNYAGGSQPGTGRPAHTLAAYLWAGGSGQAVNRTQLQCSQRRAMPEKVNTASELITLPASM